MARGRKTFKLIKAASAQSEDVVQMFNDMLGASGKDPTVFYPKYERLHATVMRFLQLLELLRDKALGIFPDTQIAVDEYITSRKASMTGEYRFHDLPEICKLQLSAMPEDVRELISGKYRLLKDSPIVASIIVATKNIIVHKAHISDTNKLNDKFLTRSAGLSYTPLEDLPALNFKQLYNDDRLDELDRKMFLLILNKMLTTGMDIYRIVSSPDVNVDALSEIIMSSIGDVKKKIRGCGDAFNKILNAMDTLKGNFDGYYKDYVVSSNPTIIMESFVMDVAKTAEPTPKLLRQFKQIIMHYRKISQQHASNPQMKTIFGSLNKNLERIEKLSSAKTDEDAIRLMEELDAKPLEDFADMDLGDSDSEDVATEDVSGEDKTAEVASAEVASAEAASEDRSAVGKTE